VRRPTPGDCPRTGFSRIRASVETTALVSAGRPHYESARMLLLSTLTADDWSAWRELRLQALKEAPYAFSATLAEWQGAGDSEARWRGRLQNVAFNVIASLNNRPAGMVSATLPDAQNQVDLLSAGAGPGPFRHRGSSTAK
jgi:hypothetical protein